MIEMIALTSVGPRICTEIRLKGNPNGLTFEGRFDVHVPCHVLGFIVRHEAFSNEYLIPPSELLQEGEKGIVCFNLELL